MDKESQNKSEAVCPSKMELAEVRDQLARAKSGPQYWRSLEELSQTEGFFEMVHREFPRQASVWPEGASRRDFMKLMTASMALAGLSACVKQPLEPIVPYVRQPEPITLGLPLFFASAMPFAGYATPVLVESHEGRPTKVEGNPDHPASLGGSDVFAQASILDMYDPDRSQVISYTGEIRAWSDYAAAIKGPLNSQKAVQGGGMRILTRTVSSPTLAAQINAVLAAYPEAKWVQYDPLNRDNARAGAQLAFGQYVETRYSLDKADTILSLDGDFLSSGFPGFLGYARQFSSRRNPELKEKMSRFYMVESTPTNTGGKADHRLPVRASEVEQVARAIAAGLGVGSGTAKPEQQKFVAALVKDLQAHKGAAVVIPGDNQPPAVHALAHAMNQALGAVGTTVFYTDPVEAKPQDQTAALKELVGDMNAGKVDLLLIVGGNPVYDAPADLKFCGRDGQGPVAGAAQPVPERDHRLRALAHQRHALPGAVGRCARHRRNSDDHSAADRSAVQRQERVRVHGSADWVVGHQRLRDRAEVLARQDDGRLPRSVAQGAERRIRRGHGVSGQDGVGQGKRAGREYEQHRRTGSDVPARSHDLRRNLRQQRVAAGNSQADDADLLGQRSADQRQDRREAGTEDRGHRRGRGQRPQSEGRSVAHAGTSG